MSQADTSNIKKALEAKGFRKRDNDHEFYDLLVDGKKVGIMTKISRGSKYKTYDDSLLGLMAKQLRLAKSDLMKLIQCTLSGDGYTKILQESGEIEV